MLSRTNCCHSSLLHRACTGGATKACVARASGTGCEIEIHPQSRHDLTFDTHTPRPATCARTPNSCCVESELTDVSAGTTHLRQADRTEHGRPSLTQSARLFTRPRCIFSQYATPRIPHRILETIQYTIVHHHISYLTTPPFLWQKISAAPP